PIDDYYLRIHQQADGQWFDLELGIEVTGRRVSLLQIMLDLMRQAAGLPSLQALAERADDDLVLLTLPAQPGVEPQRVGLPVGRLRPMLKSLAELYFQAPDQPGAVLRLHRADSGALAALASEPTLNWIDGEPLRALAGQLQQLPG